MIPANNSPTTEGSPIRWKTSPAASAPTKIITTLTKATQLTRLEIILLWDLSVWKAFGSLDS